MENKTEKKESAPSRLYPLYTILTLKNYSSAEKPMSLSEITAKVNNDYIKCSGNFKPINSSTIDRILETLCSDINLGFDNIDMSIWNDLTNCGFNIYCVMENNASAPSSAKNKWTFYKATDTKDSTNKDSKKTSKKSPKKYYYYESVFSDAELKTLIDAIETYNYFSTDDITDLVSKLLNLRPNSEYLTKYNGAPDQKIKDEDSLVFFNIDDFNQIIKSGQFAKIEYSAYNEHKELVPRKNYPRVIRPLSMMWSNGYYYLVAILGPGYAPANLRMDKITMIEIIEPTPEMRKAYHSDMELRPAIYKHTHPVMYGGKSEHITILYNAHMNTGMNNAFMDTFGKLTNIKPATKKEIQTYLGNYSSLPQNNIPPLWMRADFNATTGGVELFATQYCRYCRVISPASLAQKIKENLTLGLNLYQ